MADGKELVNVENSTEIIPFDEKVDWLPQKPTNQGMEGLGKDDVKTPTIKLLQALSPEIKNYQGIAYPGVFWHTGMNIPLGQEFEFVTALASKRVILFRPREDNGGGILAFSKDGKTWQTGGNTEFRVKIKGVKDPIIWNTGKDVISSRLTDFGTYNPEDHESQPAATISYEYLVYLIKQPELSPVVVRAAKTAVPNAKSFNTSLLTLANAGKPIQSVAVRCTVQEKNGELGDWTVPSFRPIGMVSKEIYTKVKEMSEKYSDYNIDYSTDDESAVNTASEINDEVKY